MLLVIKQWLQGISMAFYPRPNHPCHTLSIPPSDTLPGVAVRRDRRLVQGDDANPGIGGLRKMVSLRRHGRSGEATDWPCRLRCPKARAGRACAAHRVADGMVSPDVPNVRPVPRTFPGTGKRNSEAPAAAGCSVADNSVRPGSIRPDEHHSGAPPQRDPSRRQKPLNGALKGATYSTHSRQPPAPRPSVFQADPRRVSRAWLKVVEIDFDLISPLVGEMPRTGQRGVEQRSQRLMIHPPLSVSPTSPPQGGRSDRARRRAFTNQWMHSHVR